MDQVQEVAPVSLRRALGLVGTVAAAALAGAVLGALVALSGLTAMGELPHLPDVALWAFFGLVSMSLAPAVLVAAAAVALFGRFSSPRHPVLSTGVIGAVLALAPVAALHFTHPGLIEPKLVALSIAWGLAGGFVGGSTAGAMLRVQKG